MKKIRLGILGVGNMGTSHSRNVLEGKCPEFELTAIADWNADRVAWYKENVSAEVATFETCEEMINSGLIDACLIAIPHYDHPKYAMLCMRSGIHVMVEKPAGVYTKQVREMNEEAEKHDVVFGMMFNMRTNHLYKKMHELVNSGKYGRIRRINWLITNWYRPQAYYDSGDWRGTWSGEGGGVLLNQCPHQLDLWQWICGLPKSVHAHMKFGQWHDVEVEYLSLVPVTAAALTASKCRWTAPSWWWRTISSPFGSLLSVSPNSPRPTPFPSARSIPRSLNRRPMARTPSMWA